MDLRKISAIFMFLLAIHGQLMMKYAVWRYRQRLPRRLWWVRPANRVSDAKGFYNNLIQELLNEDHEEFFSLFRMWPEQFLLLARLVEPHLRKRIIRTPVPTQLGLDFVVSTTLLLSWDTIKCQIVVIAFILFQVPCPGRHCKAAACRISCRQIHHPENNS